MSDDSILASRRRVLVHGVDLHWIQAKLSSYEELGDPSPKRWPVGVRGPSDTGWIQLDIDRTMPLYHFHNLGIWMEGFSDDAVLPDQVILQSRGSLAADYWLVGRDGGSVLHGRRSDGSTYVYDLAGGVVRTEPQLQSAPVSARLMMVDRGVSLKLIEDWDSLPLAQQADVGLWSLQQPEGLFGRLLRTVFGG